MARVTIEDCIKHADDNRFRIILAASKRAHQINKGGKALVAIDNDKPTVLALREIAEGVSDVDAILSHKEEFESLNP